MPNESDKYINLPEELDHRFDDLYESGVDDFHETYSALFEQYQSDALRVLLAAETESVTAASEEPCPCPTDHRRRHRRRVRARRCSRGRGGRRSAWSARRRGCGR